MLHFIGILTPREDLPEGDERQKPFFGPELRADEGGAKKRPLFDDDSDLPRDPAETMLFANFLSPPFI
jgi:hypothetical protein